MIIQDIEVVERRAGVALKATVRFEGAGAAAFDLEYLVRAGRPEWLSESGDPFAQACIALLSNVDLRRRVAADARRLVATHYGWRSIGRQLMSLVGERREPNVVGGRA